MELNFGAPERLEASLSSQARRMVGSEILKIASDVRARIAAGEKVCDLTVGEILRAVRGNVQGAVGLEDETTSRNQAIRATLGRLERAWVEVADQTSLEKLARDSGEDAH